MSLAGVRSSRGDKYQNCIALQWAIQLIDDHSISWIEVDSTRTISTGVHIPVDDVIVGYIDGRETCCQCKKNQPKFNVWTIDELAGELVKAATHLVAEPDAEVRFYARADFGSLLQIRERARVMSDAASFAAGMPAEQAKEVAKLHAKWVEALGHERFTVYDLIKRIQFVMTKDVDDLVQELSRLLATKVTQGQAAFNELWTRLDLLGARVQPNGPNSAAANSHRITRDEVLRLLKEHGCFVAPPMAEIYIASKLAAMSAIGRAWRRDVAGRRMDRAAVDALEAAAQQSAKVLLTDGPGAGKTCVLLTLAERLEARPGIASLFIQAREFADATTAAEREALGLAPDLVALVSAMSQFRRVAVVMDSLDVLSLARNNLSLIFFLGLIDQLSRIPNVCVIAACRSFDLQYNKRLAARHWDQTVAIGALDWEVDVVPTLQALAIPPDDIEDTTRELISNPRNLALFADIAQRSLRTHFHAAQELTEAYLDIVVGDDAELGSEAMVAIERLAGAMVSRRRLQLPRNCFTGSDELRLRLLSANVLFEGQHRSLGFGHQTLLDALAVRDAERRGLSLLRFIETLQPVPFVRPAVRAYFTHLRLGDGSEFREQVRAVFGARTAFHIKRLIAEAIAALSPRDEDWPLIRHLFKSHPEHFESLYYATSGLGWHLFWMKHFVPLVITEGDEIWRARQLINISKWVDADPQGVFEFWNEWSRLPAEEWVRPRTVITNALRNFKRFSEVDAYPLLQALVGSPSLSPDWLGSTLISWANLDPRGDELLWQFVAAGVPGQPTAEAEVEKTLNCGQKSFVRIEQLAQRMASSDVLLDLALNAIEGWAASIAGDEVRRGLWKPGPDTVFIDATSYGAGQQNGLVRYGSSLVNLFQAVEKAVLTRAESNADWWIVNGQRVCMNDCGALRHIGNVVMTRNPAANLQHMQAYFANEALLTATSPPKLRQLIYAGAMVMDATTLDQLEQHVLNRHRENVPEGALWLDINRYELLSAVPAGLRSEQAALAFDEYSRRLPLLSCHPASTSARDGDYSTFKGEVLVTLSDEALAELMILGPTIPTPMNGREALKERLRSIASSYPRRFLTFLTARWSAVPDEARAAILEGATAYMRCRYGELSDAQWEPVEEVPAIELATLLLDELERHTAFWQHDKVACKVILACSGQLQDPALVDRLLFLASGFAASPDPACDERDGDDMLTTAINCSRGLLARALVDIANGLIEAGVVDLPPLLTTTLFRLAGDCHPAVRVEILRNLTFMQSRLDLGWALFDRAFTDDDERVWVHADGPFYYAYGAKFDRVRPYLDRMQASSRDAVLEIWGRISALASLAGHIPHADLAADLATMGSNPAWEGATRVWAANMRHAEFRAACEQGMNLAMHGSGRKAALVHLPAVFETTESVVKVPLGLMRAAFRDLKVAEINQQMDGVDDWLCAIADVDLDHALAAAEIAAAACKELGQSPFYDEEIVGTLLTALFREAEEREESDGGDMIKRVVALQDTFLSLPSLQLGEWLRAAERPGN